MDASGRERLEKEVRAACDAGDYDAAASLALRGYGPEILGFLCATQTSEAEADDVFAELSEVLWMKLPSFAWESTLRTWSYGVARNVSRTFRRGAGRRRRRESELGESVLEQVVQDVRTETATFLRTNKRDRLAALREDLPEEDRALLVLRVDRRLEWNDLARIFVERREGPDPQASIDALTLTREAARLRKRFQLVRERLRERAKRDCAPDGNKCRPAR